MRRTVPAFLLALGVAGVVAPVLVPTPWRYGVVYWAGAVPECPEARMNQATNALESVCRLWGLGVPKPPGDWRTPQVVGEGSAAKARELLGPDFPEAGVVVPGEVATKPLALVLVPGVADLQVGFCAFGFSALFTPDPSKTISMARVDHPLPVAVREISGPVIVVPSSSERFQWSFVHEVAHWLTYVWAEQNGLGFRSLMHPAAAALATRGGLTDVPEPLNYEVGTSLVHFLVCKSYA